MSAATLTDSAGGLLPVGTPTELDVLVYNIEYGGNASTDEVIATLDADVVGVLESYNRLPAIARRTGYPYYNVSLQLLSKFPIHEPSGADGLYALVEVQPGLAVAVFNTHLDYVSYGPKLLARGVPVDEIVASENDVRTSSLEIQLPRMAALADEGYPVVLTGDFNEPSSLDYTAEAVGVVPGVTDVVPWPVSEALLGIGFDDTFRDAHPDPVADPAPTHGFVRGLPDRIDYVYRGGPVETVDSRLVGETGGADVDVPFKRWTSDHRAVLSTLALTPVALPTTVSLDRRMLTEGESLGVMVNAPLAAPGDLEVRRSENEEVVLSEAVPGSPAALEVDTGPLGPGGYDVALLDGSGAEIATNQFWVRSTEAGVALRTDLRQYRVGDPVTVTWDDGPANRWDWIGVYRAGASDPEVDDYLLWGYTGGHDSGALPPAVSGSMMLSADSQGRPWPLPPGRYVVHYLLTDQYVSAGRTSFTVTE